MTKGPKKPPGDYDVGYCKPPVTSQFQKGQSGNPSGRRKRKPSMRELVRRELNTSLTLNENGITTRITKREAVVKRLVLQAVKGDRSARKDVMEMDRQARIAELPEGKLTFTLKLEEDFGLSR